jgi:hypothetical protein
MITQDLKEEMLRKIKWASLFMTCRDMEEEFGYKGHMIRDICNKHRIRMLTPREVNIKYIKDMADRKTLSQLAKVLNVTESYIYQLIKEEAIILKMDLK